MRRHRFDLIVSCIGIALLGYFAWHASEGPRGFPYRDKLTAQVAALEEKYQAVDVERQRLDRKVALMRPDSLDPDMLDELARADLEMTGPNDYVVMTQPGISQANP